MKKIASILLCLIIMVFTIIPVFAQTYQLTNKATANYDFQVEIPDNYEQRDFTTNNDTMSKLRSATRNTVENRDYYIFQSKDNESSMFLIATGSKESEFEVVGTKSVSREIVDSVLQSIKLTKIKEPETKAETTTTTTTQSIPIEDLEEPIVVVTEQETEPSTMETTTTKTPETTTAPSAEKEKDNSGLLAKIKSLFNSLKQKKTEEQKGEVETYNYMLTAEGVTKSKELTITLVNSAGFESKIKLNEKPESDSGQSNNIIMGSAVLEPGTYTITKIKSSWDIKVTLTSDDTLIVSETDDAGVITVQEKEMNFFLKLLRKNIILIVLLIGLVIAYFKIQYNKSHIYEQE